jgi:hypothetical protein
MGSIGSAFMGFGGAALAQAGTGPNPTHRRH